MSLTTIKRDTKRIDSPDKLPAFRLAHLAAMGWQLDRVESVSSRQWAYTFTRQPSGEVGAER